MVKECVLDIKFKKNKNNSCTKMVDYSKVYTNRIKREMVQQDNYFGVDCQVTLINDHLRVEFTNIILTNQYIRIIKST